MTDTITIHEQQGFSTSRIQPTNTLASTFEINKKVDKPNYLLRRIKFALAVVALIVTSTLMLTWHGGGLTGALVVGGVYLATVLWLTVRFAPRDDVDGDV